MINISENMYNLAGIVRSESKRINLNGKWKFEFDKEDIGIENNYQQRDDYSLEINVPYVYESKLSGIEETEFSIRVWYCKYFDLPDCFDISKGRILLHIDAMDYEGSVWVNDIFSGSHTGGYTPSVYDITELVSDGENRINISVRDDVHDPLQPSGKQTDVAQGCLYTRCTGIWQSVWLEYVPKNYVASVKITPDIVNETAHFELETIGEGSVTINVYYDNELVSTKSTDEKIFDIDIKNPVLWSVGNGNLYDVEIIFGDDIAYSYFGMRSIEAKGNKLLLNGEEFFMSTVLDQGYYPDGIYTSTSPDDFYRDIQLCIDAGFNGARLHQKIFEPGFLRAADKMGYIVWGEYPSWGFDASREEALNIMLPEWAEELKRDYNHPSIIGWCPFNEQGDNNNGTYSAVYDYTKEYDPSRLVIDTSGWNHIDKYDVFDVHDYNQNAEEMKETYAILETSEAGNFKRGNECYDGEKPFFMSEFGGAFYSFDAEKEGKDTMTAWGYGEAPKGEKEFTERLESLCKVLRDNKGICGFCYTQFTDVMQEQNGIYTYDRKAKFNMKNIKAAISGK